MLLLGAYRDLEASAQLLDLATAAQQLPLTGLVQGDVEAMVAAIAGPDVAAKVSIPMWRRSGGNPFFVRELTRLLLAQGRWQDQTHIPANVAETLRRRLARLSTECVRLLDWAAVAGRDIDLGLLTQSGAVSSESDAVNVLEEARRAGVVEVGDDGTRFTHDLYRETVLDGLSPSTRAEINLAVGRALQARSAGAARVAAHLLAAGAEAQLDAIDYSILAAREATARLGHDDACVQYLRALHLLDELEPGAHVDQRLALLLELAAALERSGQSEQAGQRYREIADIARARGDAATLARAALGIHALGHRSGGESAEVVGLLQAAARLLEECDGSLTLQSQVAAALAREMRHGTIGAPDPETIRTAIRAVDLAAAAGDTHAVAVAKLALQDSMWRPGTAVERLPVIGEMLAAALSCGDADLVAEAHLLRAAALIELGDPAGRGSWPATSPSPRGSGMREDAGAPSPDGPPSLSWSVAPTRRHDSANRHYSSGARSVSRTPWRASARLAGHWSPWAYPNRSSSWSPSIRSGRCFRSSRPGRTRPGVTFSPRGLPSGDFSVLDIAEATGTEGLAAAAVVFAVAGTTAQRSWTYERLRPLAGTHVLVAGCASYHAAVDHHLGALAASLGDTSGAAAHFRAAMSLHERLGAAGWLRLSEQALAALPAYDDRDDEQRVPAGQGTVAPRVPGDSCPAGRLQGSAGSRRPDRRPRQRRPRVHPARHRDTPYRR